MDDETSKDRVQVVPAKEVYVLMNGKCSVSRNARATWYLKYLNNILPYNQNDNAIADDDFEILSAIPPDNVDAGDDVNALSFMLEPTTVVTFIAHRYSLAFVLDLSSSLSSLDAGPTEIIYDQVFKTLYSTLKVLVRPFKTPGATSSSSLLKPHIYITIIGVTSTTTCRAKHVLVHGCILSENNFEEVMENVSRELALIETKIATSMKDVVPGYDEVTSGANDPGETGSGMLDTSFASNDGLESTDPLDVSFIHSSPDVHFLVLLRYGFLALQLLADNSMLGIVLITDGVVGLPDTTLLDLMLQQMRHDAIACSSIQLESTCQGQYGFGLVPHPELLQFIATATSGTYYPIKPRLMETGNPSMNSVHRGLLTQTFYKLLNVGPNLLLTSDMFQESHAEPVAFLTLDERIWSVPMLQKRHWERVLKVPIGVVLACRLREGYFVRRVYIVTNNKGETQIKVRLMLPWRDNVKINYVAVAPWPLSFNRHITQVEVITEATYNFFDDSIVASMLHPPASSNVLSKSAYRKAVVKKYLQEIKLIMSTDERLEHVQSFNTNLQYFTVPEALRYGVPLLVMLSSSRLVAEPQLNPQLNVRDVEPFAKFWKPIMSWEVSNWQKWFHVKRISLILDHDMPLNKHLHTPNSSGRYHVIYCKQSLKVLHELLHRMSSFTLVENHTYVTLLYSECERVPVSFYLLRVDSKPPCLMLKLSFLGGTSGKLRKRVLAQLKSDILSLRFLLPVAPKPPPADVIGMWKNRASSLMETSSYGYPPQRPSEERAISDRPCCIITRNPLNMILIKFHVATVRLYILYGNVLSGCISNLAVRIVSRYDKVPSDFTKTGCSALANRNLQSVSTANRVMLNKFVLVSTSLHHFRWIWSVNKDAAAEISAHAIGRLLSVLTRLRLCEGFHFANSDSGIHNLAIELDLKHNGVPDTVNSCIVQYIVFPPSKVILGEGLSDDATVCYSGPVPETEGEEEQSVITECWIEPRDGFLCNCGTPLRRLEGLRYAEIPDALFSSDVECISTLLTFERLVLLCQNANLSPDKRASKASNVGQIPTHGATPAALVTGFSGDSSVQCETLTETTLGVTADTTVSYVKLFCDLPRVLSKCQCVRLQFSTLRPGSSRDCHQENSARTSNNLLLSLLVDQLRQLNDTEYFLGDRESIAILQLLRDRGYSGNSGSSQFSDLYCGPSVTWHCFVRLLSPSHFLVSLVPANYSDLIVISPFVFGMTAKPLSKSDNFDLTEPASVDRVETIVHEVTLPEGDSSEVQGSVREAVADKKSQAQSTPKSNGTGSDASNSSVNDDPLLLPVFVFDCRLNVICDQIASPWVQTRPDDIIDDMTFLNETMVEITKSDEPDLSKSPGGAHNVLAPEYGRPRKANERSTSGSSWSGGSRKRSNSSNLYGGLEDLQNHCTLITETFLRCFVIGVYRSLLSGLWVDSLDIEEAINGVCEELQPIEIDITNFIQSSCRTTHQLMDVKVLLASIMHSDEDHSPSATPVVAEGSADDASSSDELDKSSGKLLLASVTGAHQCELSVGLHQLTHNKFSSIVGQFFKPVPSNKDYLFYCFTGSVTRRCTVSSSFTVEDDGGLLSNSTTEQKVAGRYSDSQMNHTLLRSSYARGSASSSGSSDTSGSMGHSGSVDPLFVHLVCSVHVQSSLRSKSVCNLPLCFGDIQDCISDLIASPEIDLSSIRVTLDLICLTLPSAEEDLKQSTGRPCYNRWTSYSSQTSVNAADVDLDSDDIQSPIRNMQNEYLKHGPFQHLPTQQKLSVQACRDQISWLLRDEIVSSMRLLSPVRADVLAIVCDHIKASPGRMSCDSVEVSLHFVYGAQESMQLFEKDLEKVRIAGRYRFCKNDEFYYLCRDRCSFTQDENTMATSSMRNLSGLSSVRSPVSFNRSEVSFEKSPLVAAQNSKAEPCCDDEQTEERTDVLCTEKSATSPRDIRLSNLAGELSQKDIQIHVQRPSPVREHILPEKAMSMESVPRNVDDCGFNDVSASLNAAMEDSTNYAMKTPSTGVDAVELVSNRGLSAELSESTALKTGNHKACVELPPVLEMASSPDSAGSAKEADTSKTRDSESNRVRPISGPATVNSSVVSEFDSVRKSRSVTDDLDESPRALFPVRSSGQLKRGNLTHRLPESVSTSIEARANSSMRRIQSNVSFDGLNGRRPGMPGPNEVDKPDSSASGTANDSPKVQSRQPSGSGAPVDPQLFNELRARHTSGLDTPVSYIDTTSVASTGEGGYEGDWSDNEDEVGTTSCSDSISGHWRVLAVPDFWLILRVRNDGVMVYFQTRDGVSAMSRPQKEVYPQVIRTVKNFCHTINQKLLLDDLYKTKHCNMLLVPKADEDVRWVQDKVPPSGNRRRRTTTVNSDSSDSDEDGQNDKYLAATLQFQPGHFACNVVWSSHFVLHPRLKSASVIPPRPGQPVFSHGLTALLTVLDKFRVTDRRNMFVIKENKSGAVFYIRLSENSEDIRTPVPPSEHEDSVLSVSQNPSMLSMALKRLSQVEDHAHVASCLALEADNESLMGSHHSLARRGSVGGISLRYRTEERITLSVHGICKVGDEISHDLIQMLRKRLDDAILDNLTLQLSRNQMHKLTVEDVQFIQKPNSPPDACLQLLVPSSAVLHQSALGHYLRQNLLQFMFVPKYQEVGRPENMFQDYTALGGSCSIQDNDVYLYRPQMGGSKGMACVFLAFVDGKGYPVNLLASPRPLPTNYKESVDRAMFDSVLQVVQYKPSTGSASKSPGPTSLIQFKIWLCGTVDEKQLEDLLIQSTRHAVCDIILEYRLLTAPICEVPPHYCKGVLSPMHSAPVSPNSSTPNVDMQQVNGTIIGQPSGTRPLPEYCFRGAIKTPKETSSSMQTLFDNVKPTAVSSKASQEKDSSLCDLSGFTSGEVSDDKKIEQQQQQEKKSLMQKIAQYENGERGFLNSVFPGALRDWLEHCCKLGVPAVAKYQYQLLTRFAIDIVLRETVFMLNTLCPDSGTALFRSRDMVSASQMSTNGDMPYIKYSPQRQTSSSSQTRDSRSLSEVNLDFTKTVGAGYPGRGYSYIMIGRNLDQWRNSLDISERDGFSATPPKGVQQRCQKFQAMDSTMCHVSFQSSSINTTPGSGVPPLSGGQVGSMFTVGSTTSLNSLDHMERSFVPRQKLFLLFMDDKKVTVYLYNWTADNAAVLDNQLSKQIMWHNARSHLVSCIALQKMGLFHHISFNNLQADVASAADRNIYVQSETELESLIKVQNLSSLPPGKKRISSGTLPPNRQTSTLQPLLSSVGLMPYFDLVYRDIRPPVPMHRVHGVHLRDIVYKHGMQALELRSMEKKEGERREKLDKVYATWQQRMGSTHPEITEDVLELLKKSSRITHCVLTPFMFIPAWRHEAMLKMNQSKKQEAGQQLNDSKERSRNNSGASVRSKRSDSIDSMAAGGVTTKTLSSSSLMDLLQRHLRSEEPWHMSLRRNFTTLYMQYLQQPGAGFQQVQIVASSAHEPPNRSSLSTSRQASVSSIFQVSDLCYYMEKTLPGGILLVELSFREVFFCVNIYTFECSRLPNGKRINSQLALLFTDECDKIKDLTHIHSFAYDFYLREMQSFINGSSTRLGPQYHLTAFLHDFVSHYRVEPVFARNLVHEEVVSLDCDGITGQQLFEFMKSHDKKYGLATIYMASCPFVDAETMEKEQFALVFRPSRVTTLSSVASGFSSDRYGSENYEVGIIMTMANKPADQKSTVDSSSSLQLRFWVILTNQQEVFPRLTLENKHGMVPQNHVSSRKQSLSTVLRDSCMEELQTSLSVEKIRKSSMPNAVSQSLIYSLLKHEASLARDTIIDMVGSMKVLCRRDLLWNRLVFISSMDEPETRRRRRTGDDDFKDPLPRLTYSEFCSLLELVTCIDLCDFDPSLRQLVNLPITIFQSLVRVIVSRYPDMHRLFTGPEGPGGSVQYVAIVNRAYVDAFPLLCIDTPANKFDICIVFHDEDILRKMKEGSLEIPKDTIFQNVEMFVNLCCYHVWTSLASASC